MITLRVTAIIESSILERALEIAARSKTSIRIEPIYRVRLPGGGYVDCDTEQEMVDFAAASVGYPPRSHQAVEHKPVIAPPSPAPPPPPCEPNEADPAMTTYQERQLARLAEREGAR